jgi:hypothetical protein
MRSARIVPRKWFGFSTRFLARAYAAPIDCFVITNEPSKSWRLSEIGVINLSESWIPAFIECAGLVQNDPDDSGVHSGFQANQPRSEAIAGPV